MPEDQLGIMELWIALGPGEGPPSEHAGEAESIYFAARIDATFATDDNAAYDFAQRRLGAERVIDSVAILRRAVASALIPPEAAAQLARSMRAAHRQLRRVHPEAIAADHFLG
jgi:predicted nucleic acid-binding protein